MPYLLAWLCSACFFRACVCVPCSVKQKYVNGSIDKAEHHWRHENNGVILSDVCNGISSRFIVVCISPKIAGRPVYGAYDGNGLVPFSAFVRAYLWVSMYNINFVVENQVYRTIVLLLTTLWSLALDNIFDTIYFLAMWRRLVEFHLSSLYANTKRQHHVDSFLHTYKAKNYWDSSIGNNCAGEPNAYEEK